MTTEQSTFLRVLSDYLNGLQTQFSAELNWPELCTIAERHKQSGILYIQAKEYLAGKPELSAVAQRLHQLFGSAVMHSSNFSVAFSELRDALDSAGIPYLPVKGPCIAEFYPDPPLRSMSDVDVMVHSEDMESVRKLLLDRGFQIKQWSEDEWKFTFNSYLFELQQHLIRNNEDENEARVRYFEGLWAHAEAHGPGSACFLDWDFHFLYLIIHISKHFRGRGLGFRQFFDLAVLIRRNGDQLHWDRIRSDAESIDLFRFTQSCLCFCAHWFGVSSPFGDYVLPPELLEDITALVFESGVFGSRILGSSMNPLVLAQRSSRLPLPLLRLKTAARLVFPSYRHLSSADKYSYLRGRPYLLPYAWAKRLLSREDRKTKAKAITSLMTSSKSTVAARHRQFKELGL